MVEYVLFIVLMLHVIHIFIIYTISGIERKNIETRIPIAEVVTCAGFLFVCFLEELIHHFVHPHKKSTTKPPSSKNDINIVIQKNGTTARIEFEMYDSKSKGKFAQEPSEESIESNDNHKNDIVNENQGQETKSLLRTAFVVASLSFHSAITGQRSVQLVPQSVTFDIVPRCFENKNNNC